MHFIHTVHSTYLEYEKVLGVDVDPQFVEFLQVLLRRDWLVVDLVVRGRSDDGPGENGFSAVGVVDKYGGYRGPVGYRSIDGGTVDEIGQPFDPQRLGLFTHDEGDRVHEVRLARSGMSRMRLKKP